MSDKESPILAEKDAAHSEDAHLQQHHHQNRKWSLQDREAQALGHLRTVEVGLTAEQINDTLAIDEAEQRRILWKVDLRLIPLLTFLYLYGSVSLSRLLIVGRC
jgi:hypothetical protein